MPAGRASRRSERCRAGPAEPEVGPRLAEVGRAGDSRDGRIDGDIAFDFEIGLAMAIGLHVRNDGLRTQAHMEAMVQFAALGSKEARNRPIFQLYPGP